MRTEKMAQITMQATDHGLEAAHLDIVFRICLLYTSDAADE